MWQLFASFFRIGLFTIGGGLAMIPLLDRIAVREKKWFDEEEMMECLAVSQSPKKHSTRPVTTSSWAYLPILTAYTTTPFL